jgi:hypothetical protein
MGHKLYIKHKPNYAFEDNCKIYKVKWFINPWCQEYYNKEGGGVPYLLHYRV